MKRSDWIWLVLAFAGIVGFAAWSLCDQGRIRTLFSHSSFYFIFVLFLTWLAMGYLYLRSENFSIRDFWSKYRFGILLAAGLCVLMFVLSPPSLRVLSDETNLLSVSQSMAHDRTVYNTTMGKFYYDNFNPIQRDPPLRPLMFPFFTYLVHGIFGYHADNVFWLNALLLFALLLLVYGVTLRLTDSWAATAAVFLVLSAPLVTISATSGGFDLCASFFFLLSSAILMSFLARPTLEKFNLLWVTLLVFANVRYESVLYLGIVGAGLAAFGYLRSEYLKASLKWIPFAIALALPTIWQRFVQSNWENPKDTPLFGHKALWEHFLGMLKAHVRFDYIAPYATLLHLLAFAIIVALILMLIRRKIRFEQKFRVHFLAIASAFVVLTTILYLSHFLGIFDHPTQSRFYLTLAIVFSLMPIVYKVLCPEELSSKFLLLIGIGFFILYTPVAGEGRFMNALLLPRETRFSYKFLEELNDPNIMVINERPGQYTVLGYGAVNFGYANANASNLLNDLKRHLYSNIIVFQKIGYRDLKPAEEFMLDPAFALEPLKELQTDAGNFVRISRVITTPLQPIGGPSDEVIKKELDSRKPK